MVHHKKLSAPTARVRSATRAFLLAGLKVRAEHLKVWITLCPLFLGMLIFIVWVNG
jgi:hypothetical protein